MSILVDIKKGVALTPKKKRSFFVPAIITLEAVLSFFLYLSIAGKIFAPPPVRSAAGVPELLSYQGRLTDTSGNPLGGAGTIYCFRYSIYDAVTGGGKVWPSGTPTNSTTTVIDGIFSDQVGRVDSLSGYDFYSTSTLYLQVAVNTATSTCSGSWEDLSPRQQIVSSAWAQTAQGVYGDALRTPTSTKVQIGTGAGQATSTMTLLSLDWANVAESIGGSCSNNGALWYNSAMTRALVCEAGVITPISNSSTTIAGIGTNGADPITGGNVVFSNSNGVSFGQNGSTITASVNAGGGGMTLSRFEPYRYGPLVAAQHGQGSLFINPQDFPAAVQFDRVIFPVNFSGCTASTGQFTATLRLGVYTKNAGSLSLAHSQSMTTAWTHSGTASSSNLVGPRAISMAWTTTIGGGNYWLGFVSSTSSSSANASLSNFVVSQINSSYSGLLGVGSNATNQRTLGLGRYTAATNGLPSSVAFSQIQGNSSAFVRPQAMYFLSGTNT